MPAIVIIKVFFRFEIVYNDYYCVNSNLNIFYYGHLKYGNPYSKKFTIIEENISDSVYILKQDKKNG